MGAGAKEQTFPVLREIRGCRPSETLHFCGTPAVDFCNNDLRTVLRRFIIIQGGEEFL